MFPGKELAYDLIWRPRFQRLMPRVELIVVQRAQAEAFNLFNRANYTGVAAESVSCGDDSVGRDAGWRDPTYLSGCGDDCCRRTECASLWHVHRGRDERLRRSASWQLGLRVEVLIVLRVRGKPHVPRTMKKV